MEKKIRIETLAVHQNFTGDETHSIARPIHPSTAFSFESANAGAELFDLQKAGNIYTRLTNPTNDALGELVSQLEGGVGGLAFASGAAALTAIILTLCQQGDHIVASKALYGGTIALLNNTFSRLGITTTYVDQHESAEEVENAFQPTTKFLLAEIIANPKVDVLDVEKFAQIAARQKVPFIVDSTFTPPYLFQPKEYGVNIIFHSATKYLGGHGNALGGVVVDCGNFDWNQDKFKELSTPSDAYHGLSFVDVFKEQAFIYKLRAEALRDTGGTISPFNAYIILTGIQTLHVRLAYISQNALTLGKWLEQHEKIEWVLYPLLPSHPDYERASQYFPKGAGGVLSFGIKGGRAASEEFINRLTLAIHAVNLGDVRTIVSHPASTTHRQLSSAELKNAGIAENLIRIAVGIEAVEDIIADIEQALGGSGI